MYNKVDTKLNFPEKEKAIVKFWEENKIFEKLVKKNEKGEFYSFFEGPPTANGKPHIGHVLTRTIKDVFLRYNSMKGYNIHRQGGWDTHGLPVEIEVEKQIGSTGKGDIEKYGVEKFIEQCKENVWKYKDMWQTFSDRMGYWVDNENAYVTYHNSYIESVWWSLAELYKKGLLYKGYRIVPYCPRCGTSLSSHEVAQGYKDVKEKSLYVKFKSLDEPNLFYLAWTTTPWTLPSNVALCMNAKEDYAKIKVGEEYYVLAKALISTLFTEEEYELVDVKKGSEYEYKKYIPLFNYVEKEHRDSAWFITNDDYVTLTDGTGIVHIAPAFGADDAAVGKKYKLPFVQLVDDRGCHTNEVVDFAGMFVKDSDQHVIAKLKADGTYLKEKLYEHSYPFCWRCGTPLLYYARSSWFVETTKLQDKLIENNAQVQWYPEAIGEGRMGGFLKGLIDWDIARNRYWGTPLPFWVCKDCGKIHVVGSVEELKKLGNVSADVELDLHKPTVDKITFKCDKCGGTMQRTPEVLDVWYDSGSMPFAQLHYPFENKELFEKTFPSEFISEGMDQTRGWFYSLLAVNTLLFGKSPYKRCLPIGLVNDEHGKKMSKSLGNVVKPEEMFDAYGTDATRWYFYVANTPSLGTSFKKESLAEFQRKFMGTLWNTYAFFVLYAEIDQFDGSKHSIKDCKLSMMDKWLISEYNKLVKDVSVWLDDYNPTDSSRAIMKFVDDLSNWYVRRSRERFWASGETEDKTAAFATLYYVLVGLSKLISPFTPMLGEMIYQNLVRSVDKSAEESVHLCKFPKCDEELILPHLNVGMKSVLDVVVLGRSARNESNIKNRQPLAEMIVATTKDLDLDKELIELIKDELNIEKVTFVSSAKEYLTFEIKPQLKTLGPKYGALIGKIRNYFANCNANEIVEVVQRGEEFKFELDGTEIAVLASDLLITPLSKEGFSCQSFGGITVILDTKLTAELKIKGDVREFVSKLQSLRKELNFEVTDHINIFIDGEDEIVGEILSNSETISKDTLANSVVKKQDLTEVKTFDINGKSLKVWIEKV